jgi:hypothetical protein
MFKTWSSALGVCLFQNSKSSLTKVGHRQNEAAMIRLQPSYYSSSFAFDNRNSKLSVNNGENLLSAR